MTAFGRAKVITSIGRFSCEIQSVNRRYLEVVSFLPSELAAFEVDIKRWVGERLNRGNVTVRVSAHLEGTGPIRVSPNLTMARQIKQACDQMSSELGLLESIHFPLEVLARNKDVWVYETDPVEEEVYRSALKDVVDQALQGLMGLKIKEGQALGDDLLQRVNILGELIASVEDLAPDQPQRIHDKLKERMERLLPGYEDQEDRLLRELCIYIEKYDIAEEITRFRFHLSQLRELVTQDALASGKKMDFTVQELHREINTIGSKSSDAKIARQVVEAKSELERIREQLQNVE